MRKLRILLFAAVFALGATGQAGASLVTLVAGTLGIGIGALPPIQFPNNATALISVSSGSGSFTEPAGVFTGTVALPTSLFTGVALIDGLTIAGVGNGTKVITHPHAPGPRGAVPTALVSRPGGGLGGPGPLTGNAFVNVLSLFNLAVPLGVIGNTGASTMVTAGTLMVAVNGTGWTTATVRVDHVTTATPGGNNVNTVTNVGYDNRTAGHAGIIQLISPFHVLTNAAGNLPGLAVQTLTFVPEPGTLLLLGSGVVGLALYGRRRLRK